jgi:hypothetical protein
MTPAQPALDAMMEGVTPGPWLDPITLEWLVEPKRLLSNTEDARFIAAARELVPALAAEVSAQRETIKNLRQMERNVQAVREFEHQRAEKALAAIAGLKTRVEALTGALRPFADYAELSGARAMPDDFAVSQGSRLAARQITMGDCRKARAALSGGTPNG